MAFCSDLTASAAYWVAAQCGRIYANELASVGSIGTYCVVRDSSKAAEAIGVTVHVVRAGAFKGAMTEGTAITEEHLAEAQRIIDGINARFVGMVAEGRGMSTEAVKAIADGRVHLASEALPLGLIDQVASWEVAFSEFVANIGGTRASAPAAKPAFSTSAQEIPVSNERQPATASELKVALPRAGADFVLACLEKELTLAESQASYMSHLVAQADAAAAKKPGVIAARNGRRIKAEDVPADEEKEEEEVAEEDEMDGDESEMAWRKAVSREMAICGNDRRRAVAQANRKNPGLRAAMLRSVNARQGRRVAIR
jgi:ClpP class serine protease